MGLENLNLRMASLAVLLIVQLGLALPTLSEPPCGRDSWRETDGLMVAANMCRGEGTLLRPQVDSRGFTSGITGMEFPLLNWLAGKGSCLGLPLVPTFRGLSLLAALAASVALFLLGGAQSADASPWLSLWIAGAFAFSPLGLYYGRTAQPDLAALSLGLWSLYALQRGWMGRSGALLSLGILLKLPVVVLGLPALAVLRSRQSWKELLRSPRAWGYAALALLPPWAWYRHARALQAESGLYIFKLEQPLGALGQELMEGRFYRLLWQHLWDAYLFPGVTALALVALGAALLRRRRLSALQWGLPAAGLSSLALSGYAGVHHLYYGLPLAAGLCLLSAEGLAAWRLERRGAWVCALLAAGLGYGLHRTWRWHPSPEVQQTFASLQKVSGELPPGAAAVFSNGDPTVLYWLGRQGFILGEGEVEGYRAPSAVQVVALDLRRAASAELPLSRELAEQGFQKAWSEGSLLLWSRRPAAATSIPEG